MTGRTYREEAGQLRKRFLLERGNERKDTSKIAEGRKKLQSLQATKEPPSRHSAPACAGRRSEESVCSL